MTAYPPGPSTPPPSWPPPVPRKRRGRLVVIVVVVSMLVIGAAGVGIWRGVEAIIDYRQEAAAAAQVEANQDAWRRCQKEIGAFVDAVYAIDSQLDVGVTNAELREAAGDAAVVRGTVQSYDLADGCQNIYNLASGALAVYASTAQEWNDCITDWYCTVNTDDYQLQWADASGDINKARSGLSGGYDPDDLDAEPAFPGQTETGSA